MKNLLKPAFFCLAVLLLAKQSYAQAAAITKDTATTKKISPLTANPLTLIVVDGVIYKGDFKDVNPDDIKGVNFLKAKGGLAAYGVEGANGVVIIYAKRHSLFDTTKAARIGTINVDSVKFDTTKIELQIKG